MIGTDNERIKICPAVTENGGFKGKILRQFYTYIFHKLIFIQCENKKSTTDPFRKGVNLVRLYS